MDTKIKYFRKSLKHYALLIIISIAIIYNSPVNAASSDTTAMDSMYLNAQKLSYKHQDSFLLIIDDLISTAKQNNYQIRLAKYYCLKGRVLLNHDNDLKNSLHYFLKANDVVSKINDFDLSLEVKNNLFFYYITIENFDEAKKYNYFLIHNYEQCHSINLKSKIANTIGNYYSNLSYSTDEEKNDSAIYYLNKSLNYAKEINALDLVAASHINLGIAYYDLEDYKRAKDHYMMAIQASEKINDTLGITITILNIASVFFDEKEYEKAIEYYKKAKNLYIKIGKAKGDYKSDFLIADCYAALGNYQAAFEHFKSSSAKYDSIYSLEKEKTINNLLIKYESEKKENVIKLKNEQIKLEKSLNERRNITIFSLAGFIILIVIIGLFILQSIRNKNKLMAKEVEFKNQEINKLLKEQELKSFAAALEAQDKERQRIAADLHDRLGGLLSTVKAYFSVIEDKIINLEEKTKSQHNMATNLLNKAVEEVRNISHDLHSGVLKNFGLTIALQDLINTIELSGSLKVELQITGDKYPIEASVEVEIYRIIQELFSNTLKHAQANLVTLQIIITAKQINIIFEDDGCGFDSSIPHKGIGLENIKSRIENMHGELNIDSRLERGTITIIDIPYHD